MNRYVLGDLMIYAFIETYQKKENSYNLRLYQACYLGHREIAELVIELGASDLNWALRGACLGGHRKIAEWMIELGAHDWNLGLVGACLGKHRNIAEYVIKLGADPKSCWNDKHCHPY